jgi:delta 1-pyrroline-5-carboxylate dehydrogenase
MPKLISTNPSKNYEIVGKVDISTDKEISEKVNSANKAKIIWKEMGIKKELNY